MFEKVFYLRKFRLFCTLNLYRLRTLLIRKYFDKDDIFLVGYPKSGNTWVAFILANVMNQILEKYHQLNLKNFTDFIPDINQQIFYWGRIENSVKVYGKRFFMAHAPYAHFFEDKKVIYIVRDPRDVVVSYWHYRRLLSPRFSMSLDDYAQKWLDWPCDWGEHVRGWLGRRNVFVLRYEDLKKDTLSYIIKLLKFVKLDIDRKLIVEAVKKSSLDRMKEAERRWGIKKLKGARKTNEMFIRKGKSGGWREELSKEVAWELERRYKKLMNKLGYC